MLGFLESLHLGVGAVSSLPQVSTPVSTQVSTQFQCDKILKPCGAGHQEGMSWLEGWVKSTVRQRHLDLGIQHRLAQRQHGSHLNWHFPLSLLFHPRRFLWISPLDPDLVSLPGRCQCYHLADTWVELLCTGCLRAQKDVPCGVTLASDLDKLPVVTGLHFLASKCQPDFSAGAR